MSINKQNIKNLLDKRNIKKVVYVDDDFYTDLYESNFRTYVRENYTNKIEFPFDIVPDDVEITLSNFDYWWESADASIKREYIDNLKIDRNKSDIELRLEQAFDADILQCISHIEFKKIFNNGSEHEYSNDNQLLVLMDKDLGGEDGLNYLSPLQNEPFIACGLFSRMFKIDYEIDEWKKLEYAPNVYPLSKYRLTENEDDFESGLRNVLWLRQISDSKEKIQSIYKEALNSASAELSRLDPASFDNAVIQNSKEEGCWEFEILQRILNIYLRKFIEKQIISKGNFANIQTLTGKLKEISSLPKPVMPTSPSLSLLRHDEIYADAEYINKTFSQISLGDIFEIENVNTAKVELFMLVCQPCNLVLRGSGDRKSKEFVYLLPIEDFFEITDLYDEQQQKKKRQQSFIRILERSYTERIQCVNFARNVRVCPRVLDLVSFNIAGEGKINLDFSIENLENGILFQENMKKQYAKIRNEIEKYESLHEELGKLKIENKSHKLQLQKLISKPFELGKEKLFSIECKKDTRIVDFHFKRVSRYRDSYAQLVLQDFMAYQSRQAFPNDFSIIDDKFYNAEEPKDKVE